MINQSAMWADWDENLLSSELLELKEMDADLNLTGFDFEELARPLTQRDGTSDEEAAELSLTSLGYSGAQAPEEPAPV